MFIGIIIIGIGFYLGLGYVLPRTVGDLAKMKKSGQLTSDEWED